MDCHLCVEKTGTPCFWVLEDLCSACATPQELRPFVVASQTANRKSAMMTVDEVAAFFRVHKREVLGWVAAGAIDYCCPARAPLFHPDDVEKFRLGRTVKAYG